MNSKAPLILLSLLTIALAGSTYYFYKQTNSLKKEASITNGQLEGLQEKLKGINVDDLPSETYTSDQYNAIKDRSDFFEERCIQYTLLIPMINTRKNDPKLPQDLYTRVKEIESIIKKYGYWGKDKAYQVPKLPYRKGIN